MKAAPTSIQLPHPPPGKLFYTRGTTTSHDKDHGFSVLRWGSLDDDDFIARRDAPGEVDLVPAGFKSQRHLCLTRDPSTTSSSSSSSSSSSLSNKEPAENVLVQFQTRHSFGVMMYAVKPGKSTEFEDVMWNKSARHECLGRPFQS